jgi:hypothetical protein
MKTKEISTFRKTYKAYDKQCFFEGLKLAVMFDEKDDVKKWGGRWNQDEKIWWMPANHLTTEVHAGVGNVQDWLNDHKMIVGQYGKFIDTANNRNLFDDDSQHYTEYRLEGHDASPKFKVQFFYNNDVAKFIATGLGDLPTEYLTIEDGRKRWDVLIGLGYERKALTNTGDMIQ